MNNLTPKNRISELFQTADKKLLSIFFTAGYPEISDTGLILKTLQESKVDLVEIGFPFSDSLVDGPTIQAANEKSLANGMNLELYFQQLKKARPETDMPFIAMTCFNPVLQYGVEEFANSCANAGVDGVILPDLPIDIYQKEYRQIFHKHDVSAIFLITSHTDSDRIHLIDSASEGFLYVVSSDATTGNTLEVDSSCEAYFERIKKLALSNPLLVGFGISDKDSYEGAVRHSEGGIIGSAFIRAISQKGHLEENIRSFIRNIRK